MLEPLIVFFDMVFSPLAALKPHISLLIVSAILTVIVLVLNKLLTNKNMMKELKLKIDELKENLTRAQKEGNADETSKFLSEMMSANNQYLKQNFKAMIVSLVVIAIFLPWLGYKYGGASVAALPFSLPLIGSSLSWTYWYILVSFAIGWVIRKLIEVE
ncbi:MAG TPA: EMC3/TMCO1 family protein [archaeon]|nr:EMC3/TMCO1 family protein [archaeon]